MANGSRLTRVIRFSELLSPNGELGDGVEVIGAHGKKLSFKLEIFPQKAQCIHHYGGKINMDNEITRLRNAQMLLTEKRKSLEDAHLVTIAAVKAEANLKSEFIDALALLKQEMVVMNEFDISTAATIVIEHAKAADEALRQIAQDTGKGALPQSLAESRELALGILDDARIVALEMLEVARQAALKLSSASSARELELIAITESPPAPARFTPSV